ncbi:terminase family protein [Pseudonocardia sp. NPDC049635]|uniref:terminase large subunit domain-containing protein n=1 Tax=Pseudonocardia sp. NPDC049635 TaxID=3155506 RepID=UPI0033E76D75
MTTVELPSSGREAVELLGHDGARAQQAAMAAMAARLRTARDYPTALDLAAAFTPSVVRTPALQVVADALRDTVTTDDGRLVVSIPPQEGKSTLLEWLCLWLLCWRPRWRIVYASYADGLARRAGRNVRNHVRTYGDRIGLALAQDHADASDWSLRGFTGGMFTTGVGGGLTGRPADVLIVDDPIKGQIEADSEVQRNALHEWWSSVARTRLAPGAPVIVVQTRWHEDDLAGRRATEGWPVVNIPALADGQTPDALNREPGTWLLSARGRTAEQWQAIRGDVGERTWAALYQGRPAPPEGGIFRQAWFDQHRVDTAPDLDRTVIAVDPADTGTGDAAGILVGGRAADGHLYVLADLSDALSRGAWARRVCLAAVRYDAAAIVSERTLGMQTAVAEAWAVIRRQATKLRAADGVVDLAVVGLNAAGDEAAADRAQLTELVPYVADVLARPPGAPCRTVVVTPRQSKQTRAEAVTVYYETGKAHHVGRLGPLEHEACTWQPGQPSPNRLDTLAHLLPQLAEQRQESTVRRPTRRLPTRTHGGGFHAPTGPRAR